MITPVILCGGLGKRLWPLSKKNIPKQLINLYNDKSLLQNTLLNLTRLRNCRAPILTINNQYHTAVSKQLKEISLNEARIICEPEGRNTAPAITLAALCAFEEDSDAKILVLPADHCFKNIEPFNVAVQKGLAIIEQGYLLTFGIAIEHPSTDFGYINTGQSIGGGAYHINAFLEKPNIDQAKQFHLSRDYYWNSGIFLFRADSFLQEMKNLCPEIYDHCTNAWRQVKKDGQKYHIMAKDFLKCSDISIDYAVMEKTKRGAVIPTNVQWFDIGNWKTLYDYSTKDKQQNVLSKNVITTQCYGNYIHSDGRVVAAIGLKNAVIIETKDAVLVADMDHLSELSAMVKSLQEDDKTN